MQYISNPAIPPDTLELLEQWVERRAVHLPGSFLTAVLSNDLLEACRRADERNRVALYWIVGWLHDNAPALSWGSAETVSNWLAACRLSAELRAKTDTASGVRRKMRLVALAKATPAPQQSDKEGAGCLI